jgi:hypothetical protein
MSGPGFLFGGNTEWTYEQLQNKRRIAEALAANMATPRNVGEGLSAVGRALAARGLSKRADKREAELKGEFDQTWANLFNGGMPGMVAPSGGRPGGALPPQVTTRTDADVLGDDAMAALGKQPMGQFRDAIASIESDGSGGYSAIGPTHPELGRALGRYQVMEANVGPWSREALGREVSVDEFLTNPQLQDAIFDHRFGGYVDEFGPQGAAQAWFAGPGGVGQMDRADSLGTTVADYTRKFSGAIGGAPAGGGQPTSAPPGMNMMALAEVAGSPFASPGQKAVAQALLTQQLGAMDPMQAMERERMQLELEQLRNPQPDVPASVEEYQFAQRQGFQGTYQDWVSAKAEAGRPSTSVEVNTGGDTSELDKKLDAQEAEIWGGYMSTGTQASGMSADMEALSAIVELAPQGPIQGRLAEAYPGFSSAGAAFNSIVKRIAPTLRAPGSGATSDIEYQGMLDSLPKLSNRPEANKAIAAMMQAKADIVRAYRNGEIDVATARNRIGQLDQQSIMSPELKSLIAQLGNAEDQNKSWWQRMFGGGEDDGWSVEAVE